MATLVKKTYSSLVTCKLVSERIVVIGLENCLLVNAYFPCDKGTLESSDLLLDMLSDIERVVNSCGCYEYILMGGDFNTNLNVDRKNSIALKTFLCDLKMTFVDHTHGSYKVPHTFSNEKRDSFSIYRFFMPFN